MFLEPSLPSLLSEAPTGGQVRHYINIINSECQTHETIPSLGILQLTTLTKLRWKCSACTGSGFFLGLYKDLWRDCSNTWREIQQKVGVKSKCCFNQLFIQWKCTCTWLLWFTWCRVGFWWNRKLFFFFFSFLSLLHRATFRSRYSRTFSRII